MKRVEVLKLIYDGKIYHVYQIIGKEKNAPLYQAYCGRNLLRVVGGSGNRNRVIGDLLVFLLPEIRMHFINNLL